MSGGRDQGHQVSVITMIITMIIIITFIYHYHYHYHHYHYHHQVSVITARSSVIRGPAISDTEDRSEQVITLTDLGYSDPSDPDWSLPFKRKVLSHYLQRRSRLPNY